MNICKYIKKFGNLSFKEKPFNTVDALILATAVYSNFEIVVPSINDKAKSVKLFKNISDFDMTIVTAGKTLVTGNKNMLPLMKKSVRFGNIGICKVVKVFDEDLLNQFYGVTYIIPDVGTYVAFRGTDITVVGWAENLNLSVHKVVLSQLDATDYLNTIGRSCKGPLYVGGHSKGGNLTLYSVINCEKEVQDKIVKAYSFDGNGLADKSYYDSPEYKAIKDRIVFIRPYRSFVGEIMYNPKEFKVVDSNAGIGIFQHNSHSWLIDKTTGDFAYLPENHRKSLIRHWTYKKWLDITSFEDKVLCISFIVDVLGGRKSTIFDFILSPKKIRTFFKARRAFTEDQRGRMRLAIKSYKKCYKNSKDRYKREHSKYYK